MIQFFLTALPALSLYCMVVNNVIQTILDAQFWALYHHQPTWVLVGASLATSDIVCSYMLLLFDTVPQSNSRDCH